MGSDVLLSNFSHGSHPGNREAHPPLAGLNNRERRTGTSVNWNWDWGFCFCFASLLFYLCVGREHVLHVFMSAYHVCAVSTEVIRGHQIPWNWSYSCEPPGLGAANQTWVLWKSSQHFEPLNHSSPCFFKTGKVLCSWGSPAKVTTIPIFLSLPPVCWVRDVCHHAQWEGGFCCCCCFSNGSSGLVFNNNSSWGLKTNN